MATGFEKFSKKALQEEPISFVKKNDEPEPRVVVKEVEAPVRQTRREITPRKTASRKRESKEMLDLTTITVQISEETKTKLDEMKFREKRKIWELTDEAINDLYRKLYGKR